MSSGGNAEHIGCLKFAEGTFESFVLGTTIGAHVAASFGTGSASITCNIIITNIKTEVAVDGAVTFVYEWKSTGSVSGIGI
jgi:hypothetical protein